jgi:hypothetical protein
VRRPARCSHRGGPLPPDPAGQQTVTAGVPACHPRPARPPRPQGRPDVGEPQVVAARAGAALPGRDQPSPVQLDG